MLKRKMLRDLMENKLAYFACLVIITIGLMLYTSVNIVMDNLYEARDTFYEEARFADGFARISGMPAAHVGRLASLEGVEEIEGRLVKDVRVLYPDAERNVYLRLVSLPGEKSNPINTPLLMGGSPLNPDGRELWVNPAFFEAQELALGDEIPLLVEGRSVPFTIVGTAQSPEFVYAMRTGRELYPMPETFGIAYLPFSVMKTLFREQDRVNDLIFLLQPGYSFAEVEERLKPRLENYGLISIFPRENQASNMILDMELQGLEASATAMPLLFLGIAGVILYILLKRMVEQQRGQIGTLKAFGYTDRELVLHYLSYALLLGFCGGILGGFLGIWLSFSFTEMYAMFFQLPGLGSQLSYKYVGLGIILSFIFSALAGYFGCRASLKLQPAEAMRPAAPPPGRRTRLEVWQFYWNLLTVQGKMATRNLFRNKQRSIFTLIGIMFAFSMMATTWYFHSVSDLLIFDQFEKVQTHDVQVNFIRPLSLKEMERELGRFPGVRRLEPMLEAPATLKHRWLEKDTIILGLPHDAFLYNILTDKGERVDPPRGGVVLAQRLADELSARVGSELYLESYWIKDPLRVKVVGVIPQYLGSNAYMEIDALNNLLGLGSMATSALLAMEQEAIPHLYNHYREAEPVAAVEESGALLDTFDELMESFGYMQYVFAVFGFIIGFAIIYNSSIVSLSERKRELASLKVMGMTPGEVLQVLTFEQWLVSILGMLAGIPFTLMLMHAISQALANDLYSIPVRVEAGLYIVALLGTAFSILVAQWTIARHLRGLSLVEVLKERD
ncbi:MAG: ABC transporter permease [Bacillota bacterium]